MGQGNPAPRQIGSQVDWGYPALLFVICGLVGLHLVEIRTYAAIFHLADQTLVLGDFDGKAFPSSMDYFYYAAEAYTSLSYNNVIPIGGNAARDIHSAVERVAAPDLVRLLSFLAGGGLAREGKIARDGALCALTKPLN